ncbi:hypothetical protein K431DRAFT_300478 [Polychaeton citri CBS 116435]|uniref:HSF-type DNA-binding domain-containing protein n=1 Tax=Polychaeton citri CBS 116435 TaxID=1314669 RepID=A0A9P4QHP4_9PEZI|nr:hypothetical protein K431DRAFT_300478 [Polychaeton citri CBS 116435]
MDTSESSPTQPQNQSMGPPPTFTNGKPDNQQSHSADNQQHANGTSNQPVGAAAAAQQPKVVQTAFIHKLYNMLEDQNIQHLISWSNSNESFVMSPSSEFSKVLAQYFKHTNISSFVRQLNMYGFHKVSDVFQTGSPDSPLWEFKHGAGNFKRGDLVGLREIKRRASRHALIHRDSFSAAPKIPTPQQPGTPMEQVADPIEARLGMLEWGQNDLFNRLQRTEDAYASVMQKCSVLLDGMVKCHQWGNDLAARMMDLVPDRDNPIHRNIYAMQQEMQRNLDNIRNMDTAHDMFSSTKSAFSFQQNNISMDPPMPASPHQRPFDESRRPSLQAINRPHSFRAPHLQPLSPRRIGSISGTSPGFSPNPSRPTYPLPTPTQPQHQHPLSNVQSPPSNLNRRHTSADIRLQGWQGGQPPAGYNVGSSPYASGQNSSAWPSSPHITANAENQQLRDSLASYELPRASGMGGSRQASPPPPHDTSVPSFTNSFTNTPSYANPSNDAGWQIPGRAQFPFKGLETPGPPTRRSSMASNVHSLLNPADTAEQPGEDDGGSEERKRKRLA